MELISGFQVIRRSPRYWGRNDESMATVLEMAEHIPALDPLGGTVETVLLPASDADP